MTDWVEWEGDTKGPPQVRGLRADIKFRSGEVFAGENVDDWWSNWTWSGRPPKQSDIVAYRVSE